MFVLLRVANDDSQRNGACEELYKMYLTYKDCGSGGTCYFFLYTECFLWFEYAKLTTDAKNHEFWYKYIKVACQNVVLIMNL